MSWVILFLSAYKKFVSPPLLTGLKTMICFLPSAIFFWCNKQNKKIKMSLFFSPLSLNQNEVCVKVRTVFFLLRFASVKSQSGEDFSSFSWKEEKSSTSFPNIFLHFLPLFIYLFIFFHLLLRRNLNNRYMDFYSVYYTRRQ